ncbi:uncharacterized protein MICPUCDRAFT_65246 [Micromonas pusilla CCMP1545]|uniref:Predicted protein n=1 Tax=Micromonas pusilla (strain CCMP1545) TaxID=564608 RepID=C1MWN3_MICPC|nr:uncharacterized protein MICPUCDRAFT_65246 [Micromonas pusilla CCMP1545]EEH55906.1 predicted protein [Micromonas pusilla CCMP1545]|eukprot:XP_003059954.1 predicted protein [Micromonas pusilla CCMP1545]
MLSVKTAKAGAGEEMGCNRAGARAVKVGFGKKNTKNGPKSSAAKTRTVAGTMSDAESMHRHGTVGPGVNKNDAMVLLLPEDAYVDGPATAEGALNRKKPSDDVAVLAAKTALLRACGDADERALTNDGPSPSLMCAVRVATANDTEVIALAEGLYAFDPERDERDDEYDQDGNKARSIRTTLAGPRATDRGFFDPDAPRRLSSTNQLTLPRTPTPTSVVASRGP